MFAFDSTSYRRLGLAATGLSTLAISAAVLAERPADAITLTIPVDQIAQHEVTGYLAVKLRNLSVIDPADPLAGPNAEQTLSLFGREDLIAASSADYSATACQPLKPAADPLAEIERRARQTLIVIINESHARSDHRGFTALVARRLRKIGYDTLAIETLVHDAPDVPADNLSPFVRQPGLPYFSDDDGFYLAEAGFGRLGRTAKALGYRLLPYEMIVTGPPPAKSSVAQQIAAREEAQARTLAAFIKANPRARLLIHVGYHHALEVPTKEGHRWMATRLKAKTGINPLTISQTTCRGGGAALQMSTLPPSEPTGSFDLIIDHPAARFVEGRPAWRVAAGDQPVAIPTALLPKAGWRVVEARPANEPDSSVPMDRVAIRPGESIALMLPPGRYRLRTIDIEPPRTLEPEGRDGRSAP